MAGARALDDVRAHAVVRQLLEQVGQRVGADLADAARGELVAAFLVLDEAGVLEHLGEVAHAVEALGRIVAEQLASAIDVDLGERAGVGRTTHEVLELVEVTELVHELRGLGEAERVLAAEVVALVPTHLGEELLQVLAELVGLPAQVHVLHELVGEALELRPLLGRHRVEHRLHRGHALRHDLEQLVEGLRVLREEVPVALHELLERLLRVLALLAHLEELVQLGEHVLHAGDVLR